MTKERGRKSGKRMMGVIIEAGESDIQFKSGLRGRCWDKKE